MSRVRYDTFAAILFTFLAVTNLAGAFIDHDWFRGVLGGANVLLVVLALALRRRHVREAAK